MVIASVSIIKAANKPIAVTQTQQPLGASDRMEFVQEFNQYSASSTISKVVVGTGSTQILATSTTGVRKYARFTNLSTTTVYLTFGGTAVDQMGIPLFASSTYEIFADKNPFTVAANGVASTSATISVLIKN